MKYQIEITETLQKTINVESENFESALEKVKRLYQHGEIVLDSNDFVDTEFNYFSE
ncbi:MAG: DpnD/PcfM family protein [Methanimicrococcus sp.]|nr:DpnD/PcfM family protein [Methanimicrococcus sp.]